MPEVFFNGPEGRIEGRYHHSTIPSAPIALGLRVDPRLPRPRWVLGRGRLAKKESTRIPMDPPTLAWKHLVPRPMATETPPPKSRLGPGLLGTEQRLGQRVLATHSTGELPLGQSASALRTLDSSTLETYLRPNRAGLGARLLPGRTLDPRALATHASERALLATRTLAARRMGSRRLGRRETDHQAALSARPPSEIHASTSSPPSTGLAQRKARHSTAQSHPEEDRRRTAEARHPKAGHKAAAPESHPKAGHKAAAPESHPEEDRRRATEAGHPKTGRPAAASAGHPEEDRRTTTATGHKKTHGHQAPPPTRPPEEDGDSDPTTRGEAATTRHPKTGRGAQEARGTPTSPDGQARKEGGPTHEKGGPTHEKGGPKDP